MGCRIQNIIPPCDYRVDGIDAIQLLDFDDFEGFEFEGSDLYSNCLVTTILRSGDFVEVAAPETAKYSSALQNGVYTHTIETFIGDLSAELTATLHLATKRRYIAIFRTKRGQIFAYGYEAGGALTYASQTTDGVGSLVTITAASTYPLFEVIQSVAAWGDFVNILGYIETIKGAEWGDFVNIWALTCRNSYQNAYSKAYNCTVEVSEWGDFVNIWFEAGLNYSAAYSQEYTYINSKESK